MSNATERYEQLAEEFYRETGMMAPGKSQPDAMNGTPSYEQRVAKWNAWRLSRRPDTTKGAGE